jgi:Copper transport outer membrane protein, MctB
VIDFRYHLVSIIAVFFALAVGIVLGAGPLGERVDEDLPEQLAAVREENQGLRDQIRALESEQEFRDGFVDGVSGELVGGRLAGRDVVVVALPDSDGDLVEATNEMLQLAGATVTATVQVDPSWTDPESEAALDALATGLVSSGTVLPEDGDGYDRGAALLAGAFLQRPIDPAVAGALGTGLEESATLNGQVNEEVVVGLEEAGFIQVDEPDRKAGLAVVIAGAPQPDGEDETAPPADPWLSLVDALESVGSGAVASGPASTANTGGLLEAIRADEELTERVSTVDSINLPGGRIAVVFAVVEQENGGVGQYGYVGAEDGLLPPIPQNTEPENNDGSDGEEPTEGDSTGGDESEGGEADGSESGNDEDGEGGE